MHARRACALSPADHAGGACDFAGLTGRIKEGPVGLFSNLTAGSLAAGVRNVVPIIKRIRTVSFSQYAEDLLIHHMHPLHHGFYVDVGAYHPLKFSNTYKLYLRGWRGITIEPNPDAVATFQAIRQHDRHLTIGVAGERSELTYYKFRDAKENTFDPAWAAGKPPGEAVEQVPIACLPLTEIFATYCSDRHVDLLSIDCEGRDLEVVQSLDWQRYRPTVVIVEDVEQFDAGIWATQAACATIRSFMVAQDYALASQAVFSSFYVDRHAFAPNGRDTGFRLDRTQLGALAL